MAVENRETALALEHLQLAGTLVTPSVDFDSASGLLTLSGVSMPEDMGRFYSPLLTWMPNHISYRVQLLQYGNLQGAPRVVYHLREYAREFSPRTNRVVLPCRRY